MSENLNPLSAQIFSVITAMAGNPNSKLTMENVTTAVSQLTDAMVDSQNKLNKALVSTTLVSGEQFTPVAAIPQMAKQTPIQQPVTDVERPAAKSPAQPVADVQAETSAPAPRPEVFNEPVSPQSHATSAPLKAANDHQEDLSEIGEYELEDIELANRAIAEHGSAAKALAVATAVKKRGRKAFWVKILEERAARETKKIRDEAVAAYKNDPKVRAEISSLVKQGLLETEASFKVTGYKFADIDTTPVRDPEQSVEFDGIYCLIDGLKRQMLSRYVFKKYGMTGEDYILHFDLPADYPLSAESFRDSKSTSAVQQQFGKKSPAALAQAEKEEKSGEVETEETNKSARRTRKREAA